MAAAFAALEARANRAVFSRLSNVESTVAGIIINGIFDAKYDLVDTGSGMMSSGPVLTLPTLGLPANALGATVVVLGKTYKAIELMPDGGGMTIIRLRA